MGFEPIGFLPSYIPPAAAGSRATVAADYQIVDGAETVTYYAIRASGTASFSVTYADGQDLSLQDIVASNGFFMVGDRYWSLGADQFTTGVQPQTGDTIVDADSVTWKVIDGARLDPLRTTWQIPTRRAQG